MNSFDHALTLLYYAFVQRAFVIGVVIALLSSLLSVFIVLKSVSLIGDGLAHTAFGGLAFSYYAGLTPLWTAGIVVVLASMGITKVTRSTKIQSDAAVLELKKIPVPTLNSKQNPLPAPLESVIAKIDQPCTTARSCVAGGGKRPASG